MSACSESQSTILPLPSSPHCEPTTTTLAIGLLPPHGRGQDSIEATKIYPKSGPLRDKGCLLARQVAAGRTPKHHRERNVCFYWAPRPSSHRPCQPHRIISLSARPSRGRIEAVTG